jgi:hypothetical protein
MSIARISLVFFLICNTSNLFSQGILMGSGTATTPDASAALEIQAQYQGFLPPRLTTAQRDSILQPAQGLLIYNTQTGCIDYWTGLFWANLCGTCQPQPSQANAGDPSQLNYQISQWDTTFHADFNNNQLPAGVLLSGSASITNGLLQLTPNQSGTQGSAVLLQNAPSSTSEIYEVYFDMFHGGGSGADNHVVYFGDSAEIITLLSNGSPANALSINFCSYNNSSYCNRVSVSYNNVQLGMIQPFTWRNQTVPVKIELNANGVEAIWINNIKILGPIALPSAWKSTNKSNWKWGFNGYCGGLNDFHRLDNMLIRCATQFSVPLNAQNPTQGNGSWTISTGAQGTINNTQIHNPTFIGNVGILYTLQWQVGNICGNNSDTITIDY